MKNQTGPARLSDSNAQRIANLMKEIMKNALGMPPVTPDATAMIHIFFY